MRRALTLTVAAGGLVLAGAALFALAGSDVWREEPLLVPTDPAGRSDGAPRPAVPDRERSTLMSTRYVTNVLLALAGAVAIVATQAFDASIVGWIAFAVTGVGVLVMTAATALVPERGLVQRTLDAVVAALAVGTIVESLVFTGTLMVWLSFGAAAAMVAIAVAGLTAHERVVHSLEELRAPERRVEALA